MEQGEFFRLKPNEERFKRFERAVAEIREMAKRDAEEAERKYKESVHMMGSLILG